MSEEKTVKWEGDRLTHWMISEIEDMKRSILKMSLEDVTGEIISDHDLVDEKNIVYQNEIVEGPIPGSTSKLSVDATIALMLKYGTFYLPEEAKQFIKECYDNNAIIVEHLPNNEELLENGRAILDSFIEAGYSYYSACALTGATFIECGWNVHLYNELEKNGKGANNTNGWKNCGEGLFGLTFWSQKEKIIKELGPTYPPISDNEDIYNMERPVNKYNGMKYYHLCDLDESYWCKIARIYLDKSARKHNEKLLREFLENDTEYLESLSASYLWKAGCGLQPEWEKALKMSEKYMITHRFQNPNPNARIINSFAQQLCVSLFVDQYLNGAEELDLNEIGIDYKIRLENGGFISRLVNIRSYFKDSGSGGYGITGAAGINDGRNGTPRIYNTSAPPLEPGLFKRNPKGFNIKAACEWLNINSKATSQHACAKWVRMAIEAGGISTQGRPRWAWNYINYLPSIGFDFVQKVKRNDREFKFEPGDIAVYMKNGNPAVPGHICMWTGRQWCSDFRQNNMIVYGATPEAYVFRFKNNDDKA